jgi:hypothetical protein
MWPLAVQEAIAAGIRLLNDLASIVLYMHSGARAGRHGLRLDSKGFVKLSKEWKD